MTLGLKSLIFLIPLSLNRSCLKMYPSVSFNDGTRGSNLWANFTLLTAD